MENETIIQIMPGDNWHVVYKPDGVQRHRALVGWALCADGIVRGLYTIDGVVNLADAIEGFEGYTRLSR